MDYASVDYASLEDGELAKLVATGDSAALEALYTRHARPVYSLALSLVRQRELAEEILQDAFLRLWRSPAPYDPERGRLLSWLLAVAHHRAIDELRRRRVAQAPSEAIDGALHASNHHSEGIAGLGDRDRIGRALSQLTDAQRQPIVLAYYGGLTQSEIAARLEIPLGTVKTRMRTALERLRRILSEEEVVSEAS